MLQDIIKAWEAGNIIANPEKWKTGAELTNLLTALVTGILAIMKWKFPDVIITEETINAIIQFLGGMLVLINIVINRISTKKEIGLKTLK